MEDKRQIDCLIVGAGLSGIVAAERLSNALGWKCVIVEKRDHIAGNAHDYIDEAGVLVHHYGPHYFRTNSQRIVDYLSEFTDWNTVEYQIKSFAKDKLWNFPINLNTFEQLTGKEATSEEFEAWLEDRREKIAQPTNSEEVITSQVGRELYKLFFEGYTMKQWGLHPQQLDPSVCGRIPIRTNRDDNYLREKFQALPQEGYTGMCERMLASSPGVEVELNTDWKDAAEMYNYRHLVYTGPIDSYFDHRFGALPYRSLRFEHESFTGEELRSLSQRGGPPGFWQSAVQVNYPEKKVPYTRIVEVKHVTGQEIDATTIVREFPQEWDQSKEPYYPIPMKEATDLYRRYATLASDLNDVSFIGRLATYRYYNMDQVIAMALKESERLIEKFGRD